MKYKELVDDIQIQFKSHNESIKTQNPYWILFRIVSEVNAIRDELLQKIQAESDVPEWMVSTSGFLEGTISNSGNLAGVYDDYKFGLFRLPEAYPIFKNRGVLSVVPIMKQQSIFLDSKESVMLRIKSDDESLEKYNYGFIVNAKLFVYPFIERVYVTYIPKAFAGGYDSVVVTDQIIAPDFIIMEARKRVLESVIIQKQIPEDDRPDGRDTADSPTRQNRQ